MKIYVAGPMRGHRYFNYPAFHAAAKELRAAGNVVFNPAEEDTRRHGRDVSLGNIAGDVELAERIHGFDLRLALGEDLAWICGHADAVAMLPGWQNSKGAVAEHATAKALGLEVIYL